VRLRPRQPHRKPKPARPAHHHGKNILYFTHISDPTPIWLDDKVAG
jgi:hypothetical protein